MKAIRHISAPLLGALALLLVSSAQLVSQVPEQRSSGFWGSIGLGVASVGPAGTVGVSYRSGRHLFSARALGAGPLDPIGEGYGTDVGDVGIMYGRGSGGPSGWTSISAGLGLVTGERRTQSRGFSAQVEEFGPTVGIPLEAQLLFVPANFLGVGLTGFANLNRESSFGGALVSLHLGRLR